MNKKKMMYGGSKKKMMMYGGKKKMMQRGGQGGPFIEKPKDMDLPKKMKDGGKLKMVKDPKTGKPTRKALALRKWDC